MRQHFSDADDERPEPSDYDGIPSQLRCRAAGCPNRWSVDRGNGPHCSAHEWAPAHQWPIITREQIDAARDRADDAAHPTPTQQYKRPDPKRLREYFERLADGIRKAGKGREWAVALQVREDSGERLTDAQRSAWRAALSFRGTEPVA